MPSEGLFNTFINYAFDPVYMFLDLNSGAKSTNGAKNYLARKWIKVTFVRLNQQYIFRNFWTPKLLSKKWILKETDMVPQFRPIKYSRAIWIDREKEEACLDPGIEIKTKCFVSI